MGEVSRREFLKRAGIVGAAMGMMPLDACAHGKANGIPQIDPPTDEDKRRLLSWVEKLRPTGRMLREGQLNWSVAAIGTYAIGTPYEAFTLERYLKAGGDATQSELLALSLTKFDCVTLVESCIAVARLARSDVRPRTWNGYADQVERIRYREGVVGNTLRVLHAPLSEGSVEISKRTLSDYVAAIKRSTGILVARPIG